MTSRGLSQSPYLLTAARVFATISAGFGFNAILHPQFALTFFAFDYPTSAADKNVVDGLLVVYGARDIFMGMAMYAAAYMGDRKTLGCLLIFGSAVAFIDGMVCKNFAGAGEWSHWGYAPVFAAVGFMLLGVFDKA